MPELNKVVAHLITGELIKGTTHDFLPTRPTFHVTPPQGGKALEVRCAALKALFFVKDYGGSPHRDDIPGFITGPKETAHGKKVAVRFKDGEILCGYTLTFSVDRGGFFMTPADAQSNNIRMFVLTAATTAIKAGPAAEALAAEAVGAGKRAS